MTRIEFLRKQTVSKANKCKRKAYPTDVSFVNEDCSLTERKALALKYLFDNMPIFIGEKELIVGTRTFLQPLPGNEDGHDVSGYSLYTRIPYVNAKEIELFGQNRSYYNHTHCTPDFSILLDKGIDGIIAEAQSKLNNDDLLWINKEFLSGVIIAYNGLKNMILRYADEASEMAKTADGQDKRELLEIARICNKISAQKPETFREAVQLFWFGHLGTMVESFEFINYGRLDVILGKYLKDTPRDEAFEIIACLLLKMYDLTDLKISYLSEYAAQLIITLGGVLPNGENAVNDVTMLFLEAVDMIRLPEPELNLRISSKNPPEFLDKASELTVSGCNFIAYFNDDLFVESLHGAGIPIEYAREYAFDLCQDINIPGRNDSWLAGECNLAADLMSMFGYRRDFETFDDLIDAFKTRISAEVERKINAFNTAQRIQHLYAEGKTEEYFSIIRNSTEPINTSRNSPMAPLPLLSALYYGCMENALDFAFEQHPLKEKGFYIGTATEAINSLAAIKKTVFDEKRYTLDEVCTACDKDFNVEGGAVMQQVLWNCPKWGNDDDYVDLIAKDVLEYALRECEKYKTYLGGNVLGGIHQPHPVLFGSNLCATAEGRRARSAVAVTLTPESGTMKNGPTAVLKSAAKLDSKLIHWNFCVMINYFASTFKGNDGKEIFKSLLNGYFAMGGMQHQPNVCDVETLKKAQLEPEKYKDLTVRLWGVSAHFVNLAKNLQDEMIERFS